MLGIAIAVVTAIATPLFLIGIFAIEGGKHETYL